MAGSSSHRMWQCCLLLTTLVAITNAACNRYIPGSGFLSGAPNDQFYTTSAMRSYRVSPVVNCSGSALGVDAGTLSCNSTQCGVTVPPYYLVNIESQLNISTSSTSEKQEILALAKRNTSQIAGNPRYDFNVSMTVNVGGGTCIPEGTLYWWGLTPTLACIEGTLEDCSGSDSPSSGTAIKACGPVYFAIGNNGLGIPSMGPNLVQGGGQDAVAAPANATIIDNTGNVTGNGGLISSVKTWAWVITAAAMCFGLL